MLAKLPHSVVESKLLGPFPGSSTVEHSAVNRRVASSNLARGAIFFQTHNLLVKCLGRKSPVTLAVRPGRRDVIACRNDVLASLEERINKFANNYPRLRRIPRPARQARAQLPSPCMACCSSPTP